MHLVAFGLEQLAEIPAILSGDSRDEGARLHPPWPTNLVFIHHQLHQPLECGSGSQAIVRGPCLDAQSKSTGRTMISFIGLHILFQFKHVFKGPQRVPNAVRFARGDYVIIRRILLLLFALGFLFLAAFGRAWHQVPVQFILKPTLMRATARKFSSHKRLPTPGRFVIEQNALRQHLAGLKFTRDQCINLGTHPCGLRVKRRQFGLGRLAHTEHLTGRRLIITRLPHAVRIASNNRTAPAVTSVV